MNKYNEETINEELKKQNFFFKDKNLEEVMSHKDFISSRKYFYDGNNGDKWEILERFGKPVRLILALNKSQSGERLFDLQDSVIYSKQ